MLDDGRVKYECVCEVPYSMYVLMTKSTTGPMYDAGWGIRSVSSAGSLKNNLSIIKDKPMGTESTIAKLELRSRFLQIKMSECQVGKT